MERPEILIPHLLPPSWSGELAEKLPESIPAASVTVARKPAETWAVAADAEVIATFRLSDDLLAAAENLRWVQALSAGVDFYDLDALRERDVLLTNASGVHAEPIAEQVLGYLLTFERGLHTAARQQAESRWQRIRGGELTGKRLGIVGLGAIGTRVAELADAFGMEVVGSKRDTASAPDVVDAVYGPDEHFEVLDGADYVLLACPLTDETRGLIGSDELRFLDENCVVVNVARGEVIDQDALVRALQGDRIGGAALDVFDEEPLPETSPLWDLPNVVVTPHMAGSTPRYLDRCADIFAEAYEAYVAGDYEAMPNRIL